LVFSSTKLESRRAEQVLSGRGEGEEDENGTNNVYTVCNAKMIPVKTVPEIRGGRMKESNGVGKFKYDIFDSL
jgi:hypothetical protein